MCMRSYAGSAPSRAAGRVTSANHLSFSLERTCCIVLDFCPHLYFWFLHFCLYQQGRLGYPNPAVFGAKFTPVRKQIEMESWRRVYLRSFWKREELSANWRTGPRFSLLRGKSSFLYAINPRSPLHWERCDASKPERVRYKERTLAMFYFWSITYALICVSVQIWTERKYVKICCGQSCD